MRLSGGCGPMERRRTSAGFPAMVECEESVVFVKRLSARFATDQASTERWLGFAWNSMRSKVEVRNQDSMPTVDMIPRSGSRVPSVIPAYPFREGHQPSGKSMRQPPAALSTRAMPVPARLVAGLGVGRGVGIGGIVFREGSNGCGVASGARSVSDSNGWPIHHVPDATRAPSSLPVFASSTYNTRLTVGLRTPGDDSKFAPAGCFASPAYMSSHTGAVGSIPDASGRTTAHVPVSIPEISAQRMSLESSRFTLMSAPLRSMICLAWSRVIRPLDVADSRVHW